MGHVVSLLAIQFCNFVGLVIFCVGLCWLIGDLED